MQCRVTPNAPLADFVRCFWYWEGAPQPHKRERLMPNGEASIIFNLRDEEIRVYDAQDSVRYVSCGHAVLAGPRSSGCAIDTASEDRVIGIQFRPGGVFPFLRAPGREVADCSVALEDVWGGTAGSLREQLLEADSVATMFGLLERGLLDQLTRPLELHPAIDWARGHICRAPHLATVAELMGKIGLSQRRFIEIFRDQVGLAPKAFCRVRRFQRVLETVHRRKRVDWVEVALDGGYYDQAHFIHEFQNFAGMTPGAYLAAATEHLNHVPL